MNLPSHGLIRQILNENTDLNFVHMTVLRQESESSEPKSVAAVPADNSDNRVHRDVILI